MYHVVRAMESLRRFAAFALAAALLLVSGVAQDRRADKSRLSIMTINCEFLWDGQPPEQSQADFPWKGDPDAAEDHMRLVAELIARADPDIVNLVEVEDAAAVGMLRTQFLAGRGYEQYFVQGKDTYTGQDVALLTRVDPVGNSIRRDERKGKSGNVEKSVSKHYIARFEPLNFPKFSMIGLHFVAFPTREDRRLERQAQADAILGMAAREVADGFAPVVLGDFNDYDGAVDAIDHLGHMPVSSVLATLRSMGTPSPTDDLLNVAARLNQTQRYTSWWDANGNGQVNSPSEFSSIDHILLSPSLTALIDTADIPHGHDPSRVTDHFPVAVWLRAGGAAPAPGVPDVSIVSLLPDPIGDERDNEDVEIRNNTASPISLSGWTLRDLAGGTWRLDRVGTLAPGAAQMVKRNRESMSLNNAGDTIDLRDSHGDLVHRVAYDRVPEGARHTVP